MSEDTIDAEVVEEVGEELERYEPKAPATLFGTDDPGLVIEKATAVANKLKAVLVKQKLITTIKGREHPKVEAWTLLGTMLGVFPVVEWSRPIKATDGHNLGWEARVEARTKDGSVVGAAEAECLFAESVWSTRDDYAVRSMAQTRAVSKALRGPLGFVMVLAGFDPTPEAEMSNEIRRSQSEPDKAELLEKVKTASKRLGRADPNWQKQSILDTAVAVTGDQSIKDWDKLPVEALVQLAKAADMMLGSEPPETGGDYS